ncbi:MAG: hypothetical protein E7252_05320 [Lachnospira sp.]|nr:hypothetical protein [Lachnospira sp.]
MLNTMLALATVATEEEGNPLMAFLAFILCIVGMIVLFLGIIKKSANKREWHIFFDLRNQTLEHPDAKTLMKEKKLSIIMIVSGIVMIVASNLFDLFI